MRSSLKKWPTPMYKTSSRKRESNWEGKKGKNVAKDKPGKKEERIERRDREITARKEQV